MKPFYKHSRTRWLISALVFSFFIIRPGEISNAQDDSPARTTRNETGIETEHKIDSFGALAHAEDESAHHRIFFLSLFLILIVAKLGGDLMERIGQPAVLGELALGIVLGNLALVGFHNDALYQFLDFLHRDTALRTIAEVGVVLLLFQIGLESTVGELRKVGLSAALVAILGVVAPFFLGWGVSAYFLPDHDPLVHVFIGAVLCATSVGITARVLQDIGKIQTREAKIILGAAIVDDVLGLIVLALVQGVIRAQDSGSTLAIADIAIIFIKAVGFFVGSIFLGVTLSPRLFRLASVLRAKGVLLTISLAFCFFFAWLASLIGLAPIVGAFCAGLVLEDTSFQGLGNYRRRHLEELIEPVAAFLVPVFFVSMGIQVNLASLGQEGILLFALALTFAAAVGKQVCSFGVREKDVDAIAVGLGMIPRGEVGLIVASIGMGMTVAGHKILDESIYAAIVVMVMITTLVTPPILAWRLKKKSEPVS